MSDELKIEELKTYEISFLTDDTSQADKILDILNQFNAEIILEKKPEKINLAYPIKHQNQAFFGFFDFKVCPENIVKIDKILRQNKYLLRFMIIADPVIKNNKEDENKRSKFYSSKTKVPPISLTNEALEKKIEEILEEK